MSRANLITIILLIGSIYLAQSATNYFQGLTIDPVLINNANTAIAELKIVLDDNFDCKVKELNRQFDLFHNREYHREDDRDHEQRRSFNLRGRRLYEEYKTKSFRKLNDRNHYEYAESNYRSSKISANQYQNPIFMDIYKKVSRVAELLEEVKKYLLKYNNVIIGSNNLVNGSGNVIIGSRDSLTGNNNWVFASDYQSTNPEDGVLIIEVYLIELSDMFDLITNPRSAIRCLKREESNKRFRNWWDGAEKRRRMAF